MKCTPRWTLKISAYIAYLQKKATPTSYPSLSTLTLSSGPSWRDPPVSKFLARGWALGMSACWISHSSYYSINGGKVDLINQLPARASPFLFMTEATSMAMTTRAAAAPTSKSQNEHRKPRIKERCCDIQISCPRESEYRTLPWKKYCCSFGFCPNEGWGGPV